MSSDSQKSRAALLAELARELQQLNGLSASFFRAAAARIGVTVTDMQVIESVASSGPMTAGQLAELTGLTTGAITGMLNRLEEAGLLRRERDPEDGRRVIVQLAAEKDAMRTIKATFDLAGTAWEKLASSYDDEQIAFLVEFLRRGNALYREEIVRLREAAEGEEGIFSAALGDLTSGQLVVSGAARLSVRADHGMAALYQARFEGPVPEMKAKDGVVTIRYPRRLWMVSGAQQSAEVTLSAAIPWRITIQGGVSMVTAELGGLDLVELEVKGGMNMVHLELPVPSGVVPVRISGGASTILVRRPEGVPARVHLKGLVSTFVFDDQTIGNVGNDVRLQSHGYDATSPGYDVEVSSSASMVTITSG